MNSLFVRMTTKLMIICLICSFALPTQAATMTDLTASLQKVQNALDSYILSRLNNVPATSLTAGAGTVVTVATDQELLNALASATGGEVIKLQPGRYGSITIDPGYSKLIVGAAVKVGVASNIGALSSQVTIMSADPNNRAVVEKIKISAANNIKIEGLSIRPLPLATGVSISGNNITILKNDISFGNPEGWSAEKWNATAGNGINVSLGEAQNIEIGYNYLKTVDTGINASKNANIHHNVVEEFRGDGIRSKDNTIVEHNIIQNPIGVNGNHTDGYQSWSNGAGGVGTGVVYNVILRNNTLINSTKPAPLRRTAMQGIGLFDGTYEDWLIENNLLVVNHTWGIVMTGSVNSIIRNNLVLDPDTLSPGPSSARFQPHKNGTPTVNGLLQGNYQQGVAQVTGNGITSVGNVQVPFSDYDKFFVDYRNSNYTLKAGAVPFTAGATIDRNQLAPEPYADGSNEPDPTPTPDPVALPTVTLSVSPTSVTSGSQASLTWSSTNATACTASGAWSGSKSTSGSESTGVLVTAGDTTFMLACTGAGGSLSKSVTVSVTAASAPAPIPDTHNTPTPTPTPTPISTISYVTTTDKVNVRATPNGVIVGTQKVGAKGVIVGAAVHSGSYDWVYVNFDSGHDGYVAQMNLQTSTVATPPTTSNPNEAKIKELLKLLTLLQQQLAALKAEGS